MPPELFYKEKGGEYNALRLSGKIVDIGISTDFRW